MAFLNTKPAQAQGAVDNIQVSGTQLTQNGQPFLVRGLQIVAFVGSESANNRYSKALDNFGSKQLQAAKTWHANTIRFQIGQPAMDPLSPGFSQQRVNAVAQGVKLARSMGFAVIVSIQDEKSTGEERQHQLPTDATVRVLKTLLSMFGSDRGIMLELYNEPSLHPSPDYWELWKNGGADPNGHGDTFIGMQQLIDLVRSGGSKNVIIVDALNGSTNFHGVPELNDPLHQVVYAVHPFNKGGGRNADDWDKKFGFLQQSGKAVLASEWSAKTGKQQQWCDGMSVQELAQTAKDFLDYIKARNIGVVGFSFDIPGTIVQDFNGTPTSYGGRECSDQGGGPGELLLQHFSD